MKINKRLKYVVWIILGIIISTLLYFEQLVLFKQPYSKVAFDIHGELIGAKIASDQQWRFAEIDSVPYKFEKCLLSFEDKRFYYHLGVDPIAILRAVRSNVSKQKITSGASTITMQLMRISDADPNRSILQKCKESLAAIAYEFTHTKKQILRTYISHAPFGGNIVGLSAASWKYCNKSMYDLNWAESALLAVLPNQPSYLHISKNRHKLLAKRNALLKKLQTLGLITVVECDLAMSELIPEAPKPLPQLAQHALEFLKNTQQQQHIYHTTIDYLMQQQCESILQVHHEKHRQNNIDNYAVLIIENATSDVKVYLGNAVSKAKIQAQFVDMVQAPRSSGSILKPLLIMRGLEESVISTHSLIRDIPTYIDGYKIENFDKDYHGLVSVREMLQRSLNVPFMFLIKEYDYRKFYSDLKDLGFTSLNHEADHYGSSIILGGCSVSLWDLVSAYVKLSNRLSNFYTLNGKYRKQEQGLRLMQSPSVTALDVYAPAEKFSAASIYQTLTLLQELVPDKDKQLIEHKANTIAWKTGTSYGFKDAWCIGLTPRYTVGVWFGNADGEGRPGLTGLDVAAPVVFDIFNQLHLESGENYRPPYDEMQRKPICKFSGYHSTQHCDNVDTVWLCKSEQIIKSCLMHQSIFVDEQGNRVHMQCEPFAKQRSIIELGPVEQYFYQIKNQYAQLVPTWRKDCEIMQIEDQNLQFVYPDKSTSIFNPVDLDGLQNNIVFKATHKKLDAKIHWFVDQEFIGTTENEHNIELPTLIGDHKITIMDDEGSKASVFVRFLKR